MEAGGLLFHHLGELTWLLGNSLPGRQGFSRITLRPFGILQKGVLGADRLDVQVP